MLSDSAVSMYVSFQVMPPLAFLHTHCNWSGHSIIFENKQQNDIGHLATDS
jgi:hypothetical protein